MNTYLRSLLLFALTVCISAVYGQTIYTYTSDTSGTYNTIAANTTAVKLTRFNGLTKPSSPCGTGFSVGTFTVADSTYTGLNKAVEADVTAASGFQLNVTGFSVGLRRSNTGPAKARLAYSTDGGSTWIDQGTNAIPNNASCGTTTTATWTVAFTVPSTSTLRFRVYFFNASAATGTAQILNLLINGTVTSTAVSAGDSIFTSAAAFGPFCQGTAGSISVPFTTTGTFTGPYYVQLSNASGIFPADATSNLISSGTTASPAAASIPASTAAGTGYRVRVVNQSPVYFSSGDNGSNIVINPSRATAVYDTICPGDSVTFAGTVRHASGTYINQLSAANGCDSIVTLYLNVLTTQRDTVHAAICQGSSFTYNGVAYTTAGTYSDTIRCDSIVTLVVTVKTLMTTTVSASFCQGSTYNFNGMALTTAGTYSDTVRCDSIVTLTLSYKTVLRTSITDSICPGNTYNFNGMNLTAAGTYSDTVRCDSIVTLTLRYKTVARTSIAESVCAGNSYNFNGRTVTAAGTYSDTVRCDSIVTLTLTYKTVARTAIAASFCQGDNYNFNGTNLTTAGTYSDTVRCDSVVTLTLTYKTVTRSAISASVCQGDSYNFNGTTLTTAGTYSDTLRCDSIVTLTLTYKTPARTAITASICQGDNYNFNGTNLTTAGTYRDTVRCDSIVTLTLTYKTPSRTTVNASVCRGNGYVFNGTTYTTAGSYSDTLRCDSIVTLVLTYSTLHRDTTRAGVCAGDSYIFHGTAHTAAGTYSDTLSCDSIATLVLTANIAPTAVATLTGNNQLSTSSFSSYQWLMNNTVIQGATSQNYIATQIGSYSVVVTNASGCSDTSNAITVILSGITEHSALAARIYPNPTDAIINVDAEGITSIDVVDMIGRPIVTMQAAKISTHTQIDLGNYASGMYVLIIHGANNAVSIQNVIRK